MKIVLYGCPRPVGGACVESGDTALLLRQHGIDVDVLPAGRNGEQPDNPWLPRLRQAGCKLRPGIAPELLPKQDWLRGQIVVDFACEPAVRNWPTLEAMGCKLIHVGCHTAFLQHELDIFTSHPPTAVVFQSEFQRQRLWRHYEMMGVQAHRHFLIHGALDLPSYPFKPVPHKPGEPFIFGRLARPVAPKWPRSLWTILEKVRRETPAVMQAMGWLPALEKLTGQPGPGAIVYPPNHLPVQQFLGNLHALVCLGGEGEMECAENWPRVTLEAMACGVPVVAEAMYGFLEQISHGATGLLCDTREDFVKATLQLARDEPLRQKIITNGRANVERLADPQALSRQWKKLFAALNSRPAIPHHIAPHQPTPRPTEPSLTSRQ